MSEYLAILKASYDYEPQSEDEVAVKEDQLLFLLERTDDEWWKVKIKGATAEEDETSPIGLVPAAYVESAQPTSTVKALYDYEASAPGELTVAEDEVFHVYTAEEDWLLVQSEQDESRIGYVPGNYVERFGELTNETNQAIVVPDSPPSLASNYVDPAERVAANKLNADEVGIWPVSEIDQKGKKKKGTLGVGSGAVFFSSEADKTPVQKWKTADISAAKVEKSKDILVEIGGATPATLRFHAGSKDDANAIVAKLESSKAHSTLQSPIAASPSPNRIASPPPAIKTENSDRSKSGTSVHFSSREPSIISPREPPEGEEEGYEEPVDEPVAEPESYVNRLASDDGERAVALYDFIADGEDELSITEGGHLLVLEKDNDEWWKVRDADGLEGVVPASYVELLDPTPSSVGASSTPAIAEDEDDDTDVREAEEARLEAERAEEQRQASERAAVEKERKKKAEEERRARAVAAAEKERKRMEQEAAQAAQEAERERRRNEEERQRKKREEDKRETERSQTRSESPRKSESSRRSNGSSRPSQDRPLPSAKRVRLWHDKTGQFQVDAEFLGTANGKIRLHKTNGVVIEVPLEKMSPDDLKWIEKHRKEQTSRNDDDDEPLAKRRESLAPTTSSRTPKSAQPTKKTSTIDWFEFFLSAGCEIDDCTRYAGSFERDKIDETILPDITESTMRSLGLREGDIIRVKKLIRQRAPKKYDDSSTEDQVRKDAELAAALQAEENGGKRVTSAPNLFTSGPGGALKPRRGRPTPSNSTPPINLDLNSIANASDQISRSGSPTVGGPALLTTSPTTTVQPPKRASSAAPAVASGFDDDAWTPRPSSTRPQITSPAPATAARAPSAPPAQTMAPTISPVAPTPPPAPMAAPTAPTPPAQPSAPPIQAQPATKGLSQTTENDVFNQLARLSALRSQTPVATPSPPQMSPPIASPPMSPPTIGYSQGMGMGSSPMPLGQHLMSQPTGMAPTQFNSPRGPLAPVPANQGLLQPLIPTTTGFNNFVPTRASTNPTGFQSTLQPLPALPPQPTGFFGTSGPLMSQPTGFAAMMSQPTGFPDSQLGNFNNGAFTQPNGFASPFNNPPPSSTPVNDHSPANVFAKMKSGNFGEDQQANYDALRPNSSFVPMATQPTGWAGYQGNGYSGY